jgi:predicted Zn-dependent protease
MSINTLKKTLENFSLPNADWIGIRQVRELSTVRYARDGRPQANSTTVSYGTMVEVLAGGHFGYAATSRTDTESLRQTVVRARDQALSASQKKVFEFTQNQRPLIQKNYTTPVRTPLGIRSAGDINALLIQITEKLKRSPKIVRTTAIAELVESEMHYVSTNGSCASQTFSLISTDFEATAQEGTLTQKRSDSGHQSKSYQGGLEYLETPDLWERVERVAEQSLELLSADECPTEKASLILMPDQMMLQIHESIGHPLELDRILGDERNYAGWSFVNPEDFGKLQYGSSVMNVTFDPTIPHEFASYTFDDNGCEAKKQYLIKNGILLRGLGGLESQARSGIPGVANARSSSWNRPPIDRMANLNLEPGESSLADIISSVERGVIMETNRSWSIDDFRNKFQFGCEYAKLIENGKIVKTLRNPNYRGMTLPFWRGLKRVGNQSTLGVYGTPNCGKGEPNQAIRVGHASPVCLFEGIEVFGGAH